MSTEPIVSRRRWWLCLLLFGATALSFLDRQVLSVLAPVVKEHLGMSNAEYSYVTTAFMLSYALMFLVGGRLMDVLGTRLGMALCVGIWSVASAFHAMARNAMQLGAFRFLLGVGEGGCFPGAAKGVAEWFAPRERAMAMGLAIGGASLGAVAAPPLTVLLAEVVGWRGVFVVTGLIGAAWVGAWWMLAKGSGHAAAGAGAQPAGGAAEERPSLGMLLKRRDVWGLAVMRFIFDPVFYFYMFWIPTYLSQARGISLKQIGNLSWIPFLALGISNIAGGWVSDRMIRSGVSAPLARRLIMAAAALLTVASSFAGRVQTLEMALTMMSLLMLAHGFWITNYVTLISERFPRSAVGTVMGFAGMIGAFGGMCANTAIGQAVDKFGYASVWLASGLMYPMAFVVLLLMLGGGVAALNQATPALQVSGDNRK